MKPNGPILYEKINTRCRECGFKNITELCAATGASRSTLSELHNGRSDSLNMLTIRKLAPVLHVTPEFFFADVSAEEADSGDYHDTLKRYMVLLDRRQELQTLLDVIDGVSKTQVEAITELCRALLEKES